MTIFWLIFILCKVAQLIAFCSFEDEFLTIIFLYSMRVDNVLVNIFLDILDNKIIVK